MKVLIVVIPWVKVLRIHFACFVSLNKSRNNNKASPDWNLQEIDNFDKTYYEFFTHFDQPYHQTHAANQLTSIVAKA